MTRVTIEMPDRFAFRTEIPVLIGHINRGDHVANEALVALLNEARVRFLAARAVSEFSPDGLAVVNADLTVSYRSEARYGDTLVIEVAATGFHRVGYDIVYRVTAREDQRLIAQARTSHVVIDMQTRRAVTAPAAVLAALEDAAG